MTVNKITETQCEVSDVVNDTASMDIANKLRSIRMIQGRSQMGVAADAGMHYTYYSQIERGIRRDISVRLLKKIADALGVTVGFLVDDEPDLIRIQSPR